MITIIVLQVTKLLTLLWGNIVWKPTTLSSATQFQGENWFLLSLIIWNIDGHLNWTCHVSATTEFLTHCKISKVKFWYICNWKPRDPLTYKSGGPEGLINEKECGIFVVWYEQNMLITSQSAYTMHWKIVALSRLQYEGLFFRSEWDGFSPQTSCIELAQWAKHRSKCTSECVCVLHNVCAIY